ncbi:hypothetical protein ACI3L1_18995, partial [Deinococcus sp. SM5_A1]|uniref:hypothetical protein n=1 Tax=Deinococcus sp. SM5_A1 TaxID=3379094 RepID=UPI00385A3B78
GVERAAPARHRGPAEPMSVMIPAFYLFEVRDIYEKFNLLRKANCKVIFDLTRYLSPIIEITTDESYIALSDLSHIRLDAPEMFDAHFTSMSGKPDLLNKGKYIYRYLATIPRISIGDTIGTDKICFYLLNTSLMLNPIHRHREELFDAQVSHKGIVLNIFRRRWDEENYHPYELDIYVEALKSDGTKITYEELIATEIFKAFKISMTLLSTKIISPFLFHGVTDDSVIWRDFSRLDTDKISVKPPQPHREHASRICINADLNMLEEITKEIAKLEYESELKFLVEWYTKITNANQVEESIALTQIALEGIAFWYLVSHRKAILSTNYDNLKTGDWLRLLLTFLDIPVKIPDKLINLSKICDDQNSNFKLSGVNDGPLAFVNTRNYIVHRSDKNLAKLRRIEQANALQEVASLGQWYVEMIFLKLVNYQGIFHNAMIRDY